MTLPHKISSSHKPIEEVFLELLLKLSLTGILIITAADMAFTHLAALRSVIVNFSVLFAVILAFLLHRLGYYKLTVLLLGFIILAAMLYQDIAAGSISTLSMPVIMGIGFAYSVLLKERLLYFVQGCNFLSMVLAFGWQIKHPQLYGNAHANDFVVSGIAHCTLYLIIAFSTWMLKRRYDEALKTLACRNLELFEKTNEIETQNEELVQSHENLAQLNNHLEQKVQERTIELEKQNELLIKYAYTNAHHLRGPVARLLGLIYLSRMEPEADCAHFFNLIEAQAKEIDDVVRRINKELE